MSDLWYGPGAITADRHRTGGTKLPLAGLETEDRGFVYTGDLFDRDVRYYSWQPITSPADKKRLGPGAVRPVATGHFLRRLDLLREGMTIATVPEL